MTGEEITRLRDLGYFYGDEYGLAAFEGRRLFEEDWQLVAKVLNMVVDNFGGEQHPEDGNSE